MFDDQGIVFQLPAGTRNFLQSIQTGSRV